MALDLSKPRSKPSLGRGKIPEEVRRRLDGEQEGPPDTDPAIVHKIRRLKKSGQDPREFVEKGLREVGGIWDQPRVEVSAHPEARRRKQRYEDVLTQEQSLPENIQPVVLKIKNLLVRAVPSLHDEIDILYNRKDHIVEMTYRGRLVRFTTESAVALAQHQQKMSSLVGEILLSWGFKYDPNTKDWEF